METGDKSTNPFLTTGDFEYIQKLQFSIDGSLNKLIQEIIDAQNGAPDLHEFLEALEAALIVLINARVAKTGLTADLSAGGFKIINVGNTSGGNGGTEAVNWTTAQAIFLGGGTPSSIPITSLGVGAATPLQLIRITSDGLSVEGYTYSDSWKNPVNANFNVVHNSKNLCDISAASFTATLLASPTIGGYYKFKAYGSALNILTIARNGCTITRNGVNIDAVNDGNLILNGGDFVELVCTAANTYEVV